MNIGIFGDTHYTNRGPSRRKDNFFETQKRKTLQSFSIFKKHHCQFIFHPGDVFDSHTTANEVQAQIISLLKEYLWHLLFVSGQHDISGHSLYTLKNSPLAVLQAAGVGTLLNSTPIEIECLEDGRVIQVYGASYGESIPEPKNDGAYNILVLHKMIGDRELFPGQELVKPNQFLRNNPKYNLVICGDYHFRFSSQYQGRTIINAGCLVRKTISVFDLEHKPSVAIFNTETSEVKFEELDIQPMEEVFDLGRESKIDKAGINKLIQQLKSVIGGEKKNTSYKNLLLQVIQEKKCSEDVKKVIDECLEEVQ